jgi:arsenate reductase
MPVTIWHNPACGTSRKVLAAIREAGIEPVIVDYLKTPPGRGELYAMLRLAGMRPGELLRRKEALVAELGLDAPDVTEERLVEAMLANPRLIERPVVITQTAAALCRPVERVQALLAG